MRTLTLKKETLNELTPDELTSVVGAAGTVTCGSEIDRCLTARGCTFTLPC